MRKTSPSASAQSIKPIPLTRPLAALSLNDQSAHAIEPPHAIVAIDHSHIDHSHIAHPYIAHSYIAHSYITHSLMRGAQ